MKTPKALVLDIETVGERYEDIDTGTRAHMESALKRRLERAESGDTSGGVGASDYSPLSGFESGVEQMERELGLSPLTGFIVAIGMHDTSTGESTVVYSEQGSVANGTSEDNSVSSTLNDVKSGMDRAEISGDDASEYTSNDVNDGKHGLGIGEKGSTENTLNDVLTPSEPRVEGSVTYRQMSEPAMLRFFWKTAMEHSVFVTFSGWSFDIPFIKIRSAIHGIRVPKNLMPNRFLSMQRGGVQHIDLQDQFSYYAAVRKKSSLHLYCRAFGIASPKENPNGEDISGSDVGELYRAGRGLDIARYNARDITATAELYAKWNAYLNV